MIWRVLGSDLLHEAAHDGLPGNGSWKKESEQKSKSYFAFFLFLFRSLDLFCFVLLISWKWRNLSYFLLSEEKIVKVDAVFGCCNMVIL